ncbi:lactam utilization protein lamb [Irpex rosettiformis]|uniref:Lactam utilization protein lamb n=1 Tax=Irpex rosettiformis TaxID=378272 RepID=A0ACB8TQH3_9APHY|nr:lactam utilization protein lamb [Irpex rosettiformis]
MSAKLKVTVNCDMGEGYSLYKMGEDDQLIQTIHLANVACGFHASDFMIMDKTVLLAKHHNVRVGAHPSLPDRQGFGRREMIMDPDELNKCFTYQVGALTGFLNKYNIPLNHIKPHGAVYGMITRDIHLARASAQVAKSFNVPVMGLAGTCHQQAAVELGVPFIAEWFADLEYSPEGTLLITREHVPVSIDTVKTRVTTLITTRHITTVNGTLALPEDVDQVSICCHSDTPGAVEIARTVKKLVDSYNST